MNVGELPALKHTAQIRTREAAAAAMSIYGDRQTWFFSSNIWGFSSY